jgi:hypothetical protein
MNAIIFVKPDDIATVNFDSSALTILEDDESFGDEGVEKSIAAQADQTRPTIPSLPSIPFPVRDKSVCTHPYLFCLPAELRSCAELSAHARTILLPTIRNTLRVANTQVQRS